MCQTIVTSKNKSANIIEQHQIYGSTPYGDYLLMKDELLQDEINSLLSGFKSIGIHFIPKSKKRMDGLAQTLFNMTFLQEMLDEHHKLTCVYCGKEDLIIYQCDHPNKDLKKMATADHFNPKSKGGAARDKDNLVVSCQTCNKRKSNLIWSLDTLKYLHVYGNEKLLKKKLVF